MARENIGSLHASTLPPSFELREGENLPALLSSFTVIPGPVKNTMSFLKQPMSKAMIELLTAGGHSFLTRLQENGEGTVLFSVDAGLIGFIDLRDAIEADGYRRNLHWRLVKEEGIVPMYKQQYGETEDVEAGVEEDKYISGKESYRRPARYILSFEDQAEARRFVRNWHRRPFQYYDRDRRFQKRMLDEKAPIVNAQIMW